MDFLELAQRRYSVRAYKSIPVENEKLQQILEAVRIAPTASNRQPFQLIVIHTKGREEKLKRIYGAAWFVQAPLVICACSVPSQTWIRQDGKEYCEVDVTIAMDHLIMAATELGLGTCWIAAFDPIAAREVLRLSGDINPILFTPLGYPADQPKVKIRKTMDELVRYEH
jgi:nitroreductase